MEQQGSKLNADQQKLFDLIKVKKEIPVKMAAKELGWDEEKIHHEVITLRHVDLIKTKTMGPDTILSL
jgi:predicted transcriptional regulator